jgi:hypothetical protein
MPCSSMIQSLVHPPPSAYPSHAHLNLYNLYAHFETKFRVGDGFWLLLDGNLVAVILAFLFSLLLSNYRTIVEEKYDFHRFRMLFLRHGLNIAWLILWPFSIWITRPVSFKNYLHVAGSVSIQPSAYSNPETIQWVFYTWYSVSALHFVERK